MLDNPFRRILPRYVDFILKLFASVNLTPNHITWAAFFTAIASAGLVYSGELIWAAVVWWLSRLWDACDGIYARKYNKTSKYGAFLDVQLDMAVYGLMVVAFFFRFPEFSLQWVLILFFYVLCITGALSLGGFENTIGLEDRSGRGLRLATGLAEGGETGIFYTVFLIFPDKLAVTTWVWIGVLVVTVVARFVMAARMLKGNT